MAAAVRYAVRTAGLPLLDVVRAASTAPARVWALDDVGALEAGRRADLVVLDEDLQVARTMRAGAWVSPWSIPRVRPETNCFCSTKNTISTGSATMIDPAATRLVSVKNCPRRLFSAW